MNDKNRLRKLFKNNDMTKENYWEHNVHIEKLNEWILENHVPSTDQRDYGCEQENIIGCHCDDSHKDYVGYYDKYDSEDILEMVDGLTEEEKEFISDLYAIRIYVCGDCGAWSVDGDNI